MSIAQNTDDHQNLFCQLYHHFYDSVYTYLFRMIKDRHASQDITQDVFCKLWSNTSLLRTVDNPEAYLYRMARNEGINYLNRQQIQRKVMTHIPHTTSEELTLIMVQTRELERAFQLALQHLSSHRRTIYVLGQLEGWKRQKIALTLGITESTVKELMRRTKIEIRTRIASTNQKKIANPLPNPPQLHSGRSRPVKETKTNSQMTDSIIT